MGIEQFKAQPKTVTERYKDVIITAKYNQELKVWDWWFEIQSHVIRIGDRSESLNAAIRAAKKKVDTVSGGKV